MASFSKPSMLGMLFAVIVLLQAVAASKGNLLIHPVHNSPEARSALEAHVEETRSLLKERANNVAIRGPADGAQYPRLEIRDLERKGDQWNLYLLAMERFKNKPKNDRLSYYAIAGIHGRPFVPWNGQSLKHQAGYCPHNSAMFGSWHRPYLSIYEQAVYQNAQEVVASFPANQQQRWRNALTGLRIPYFDWAQTPASGQPAVPRSMRDQTVTVTKPNGRVNIPNPLYSYSFGNSLPSEMGWGPANGYPATLRRPQGTTSNNNEVNAIFAQNLVGWRQRVFALFSSRKDWGLASNSQFGVDTSRRSRDSYESIHDDIHGTTGGNNGHMSYLDVAAFDPFFWLHHANVDRLLTMHQWIGRGFTNANTIQRDQGQWSAGERKDKNSPLVPFTRDTNGAFYSSSNVEGTRALGYYYPETRDRTRAQVVNAINRLYGQGERPLTKRSGESSEIYPGRPFQEGDYDTVLNVMGDKWALPGSYQVHCFLGNKPVKDNSTTIGNGTTPTGSKNTTSPIPTGSVNATLPAVPSTNLTNGTSGGYGPGYVGSHTFLGGSVASINSTGPNAEGCIPLTAALQGKQAAGELNSLHPDDVEPYLKENLHYKIIGPGGEEYQPEQIPNFHVQVASCPVTPSPSPDELPGFGDYVELPRVDLPASNPPPAPAAPPAGNPENPSPAEPGYSTPTGAVPYPNPWDEPGYCVSHQTINYVDPNGQFLYSETS